MSQKYPGGFITKSPVAPTSSAASGMWTLDQAMQLKKQGLWPTRLAIGDAYQGGYFAGQISTAGNSIADYNLVVGPLSSAQKSGTAAWKTTNTSTTGTSSVIDGPTNSANMNNASHPAAQFCEAVNTGGYADWYLPAQNELEVCYYNLKSSTTSNNTSSGINSNAVPARASNYTTGNPAQTSATEFKTGGTETFTVFNYWSSTEFSATQSHLQVFGDGRQYALKKYYGNYVRAIRRVAI